MTGEFVDYCLGCIERGRREELSICLKGRTIFECGSVEI
jgi:hypothetical protein